MNPGPAAPPQNLLLANPQLALLAMQMLQGRQPQQPHVQQNTPPTPQLQAPAQLTPLQAKEKDYHNAQSEQVDTTLALFIGAGKSAGESKFAALENMDTVRINR